MLNMTEMYKSSVYQNIRQFNGMVSFKFNGKFYQYDDEQIMKMEVIEDVSPTNDFLSSNECRVTLDNSSGEFDFLKFFDLYNTISQDSYLDVYANLVLDGGQEEYMSLGHFILFSVEQPSGSNSVVLVGRDQFSLLDEKEVSYGSQTNLYDLANSVLDLAGVSYKNIHDSLKSIATSGFTGKLNAKEVLQYIGIASRCVVFQDRFGAVVIQPVDNLDSNTNYLTYTGQSGLYAGSGVYSFTSTGGGMKILSMDQMYQEPVITLERSIASVKMVIHNSDGTTSEVTYQNPKSSTLNGTTFTLDCPLVHTSSQAQAVALWVMSDSDYNARYEVEWRQNPGLECLDVVLIEDSQGANKQARITRNEFLYEGYLMGRTEGRGGM